MTKLKSMVARVNKLNNFQVQEEKEESQWLNEFLREWETHDPPWRAKYLDSAIHLINLLSENDDIQPDLLESLDALKGMKAQLEGVLC